MFVMHPLKQRIFLLNALPLESEFQGKSSKKGHSEDVKSKLKLRVTLRLNQEVSKEVCRVYICCSY